MSRTKSFEEATDSLLAGSANLAWRAVNYNNRTKVPLQVRFSTIWMCYDDFKEFKEFKSQFCSEIFCWEV
jgi:hypothetical protein